LEVLFCAGSSVEIISVIEIFSRAFLSGLPGANRKNFITRTYPVFLRGAKVYLPYTVQSRLAIET
jgi:hypothetical protein